MKFEFDNNLPIYMQLVEQLKIQIISGNINIGERLPSVRELSNIAKVNPNTMQKALFELEDMKLIYTERTNGKFVTSDQVLIEKYKKQYADELTRKYFFDMYELGLKKDEIIKYIEDIEGEKKWNY